jgi:hypothetical protein
LAKAARVVPVPGTTPPAHRAENVATVDARLAGELVGYVDALTTRHTVVGPRYGVAT